jgi:hypothetical protein
MRLDNPARVAARAKSRQRGTRARAAVNPRQLDQAREQRIVVQQILAQVVGERARCGGRRSLHVEAASRQENSPLMGGPIKHRILSGVT